MNNVIFIGFLFLAGLNQSCAQNPDSKKQNEKEVGGGCEGCEAVHEYGVKNLTWVDTLPDFHEAGPKLEISGTIYHKDGKTPVKDVILYIYHTDQKGEYSTKGNAPAGYLDGWGRRHGYIRGWIKTNADGKYIFYTLRPAAYPGRQNPEHIHPIIKEPGIKEYWIDEYLFEDDPILSKQERSNQRGRGGVGLLKTAKDKNGMQIAKRDIILGVNVPGYE